ncbi:unnamed protein product [Adineta steineri]|uniref:Uncharacterized protein n=1 Tax=Adineta steineri TaxID=433720 RepID=A0A815QQG8_9BILA|nr:unnamed protein product [Adineta steineri]
MRWLTLKIDDSSIIMNDLECFLTNFSYLTQLQLDLIGEIDLVDGNRWKRLSKDLIKFNFDFHVEINNINSILDSFRNSYWLLNKCWYVAYDNQCPFTVPYFAPILKHSPYYPTIYLTVPDNIISYDQIKHIVISKPRNIILKN